MRPGALAILFALSLLGCGEEEGPIIVVLPTGDGGADARIDTDPGVPDTAPPTCSPGQTMCNGRCVPVMDDPMNCGGCGTMCPSGSLCTSGMCMVPPPTT